MKITKPKTIIEALNELEEFFQSDLYTKLRPSEVPQPNKNEKWIRDDSIEKEGDFIKYIRTHFKICRNQIKECLAQRNKELEQLKKMKIDYTTSRRRDLNNKINKLLGGEQ